MHCAVQLRAEAHSAMPQLCGTVLYSEVSALTCGVAYAVVDDLVKIKVAGGQELNR
jgi:hypothetical protein